MNNADLTLKSPLTEEEMADLTRVRSDPDLGIMRCSLEDHVSHVICHIQKLEDGGAIVTPLYVRVTDDMDIQDPEGRGLETLDS